MSYAEVVTDDLRVRSKPGVSDDSIKLKPRLQAGRLLAVVAGPVRASGYDWYQVEPLKVAFSKEKLPFGWVAAASREGERWIEPMDIGCPDFPDNRPAIDELDESGERYFGVTCFSGREVTLTGLLAWDREGCIHVPAWGFEPAPFDACTGKRHVLWTDDGGAGTFVWSPDIDLSVSGSGSSMSEWPRVEVTAQFDHPAAALCRNKLVRPELEVPEPDPALTVLRCRNQLVVTSMRVIQE